jgi:alkaline phosphatase
LTEEAVANGCPDIASQLLLEKASKLQVMMGGGRSHLWPANLPDPEYPDKSGKRKDGRNIADLWLTDKKAAGKNAMFAWHRDNLTNTNVDDLDFLLGTFEQSHMKYSADAGTDDPTLAEMTEAAIKILQKNDNGFFLFVEGAKIDLALHESWAKPALEDVLAFEEAIQKAMDMTDEAETLIIVTADHSHGITFGSYPLRGNPILGFTDWSSDREPLTSDSDHLPYTTVSFSNGPGINGKYKVENGEIVRVNLTQETISDRFFQAQSPVPAKYVGHEGSDVAIYARGPWSHLFHTVHEQNYIAHVMAYASCVGDYSDDCPRTKK